MDERLFQRRLTILKKLSCDEYTSVKSNSIFLEQLEKHERDYIENIYKQIFWTLRNDEIADQRNVVSSDFKRNSERSV